MFKQVSRIVVVVATLALCLSALLPDGARAVKKRYNAVFEGAAVASTLAAGAADTCNTINMNKCDGLSWVTAFEGDSCLVTVQGSEDETNWTSLGATQVNGTDGTYAIQWSYIYTVLTTNSKNDIAMPPPRYVRVILNNNDTTGSDDMGVITFKAYCDQ